MMTTIIAEMIVAETTTADKSGGNTLIYCGLAAASPGELLSRTFLKFLPRTVRGYGEYRHEYLCS